MSLVTEWNEALDNEIMRRVEETGVQPGEWRAAGRKSKAKPNGEDLDWWRGAGAEQLALYEAWLTGNNLRIASIGDEEVPGIEWGGAIQFPGGAVVRLYIDLVLEVDGGLWIVDLKTGSRTPPGHGQLALYATALELVTGDRPSIGSFYMTRDGEASTPASLDHMGMAYWDAITLQVQAAYRNSIFVPKVDTHCVACGVRQFCYAQQGARAAEYDSLANPNLPPLTEEDFPPHLSYSQINSWLWCGKQAELSRLRHAQEAPTVSLVAGSAFHTVAEQIARRHYESQ